jgi:hypothetical protein
LVYFRSAQKLTCSHSRRQLFANAGHRGFARRRGKFRALRVEQFCSDRGRTSGHHTSKGIYFVIDGCCRSNQEDVMKKMSMIGATLLGAAVLCAAPISLHQSQHKGLSLSLDSADARVGHPLSAGSVAGVHRRATRRAVRHGY